MKKGNAKLVLIGLLAFTALAWLGLLKNQIDSSSAYRKYLEQGQRYEEKGMHRTSQTARRSHWPIPYRRRVMTPFSTVSLSRM